MISFTEYKDSLEYELARYGFTSNPINDIEMKAVHAFEITLDEAYGIACDANTFPQSFDVLESIETIIQNRA